jgi:methyl-accepting chemotaxis protein
MISTYDQRGVTDGSEAISREIRNRVRVLVLASMLTVALAFGLTFYFALIASESAVARQVPELEGVAAQLKSLLIMNTLVFVAIIIASFFVLSSLITARMFHPLALLHKDLLAMADGALARSQKMDDRGPFAALDEDLSAAVSSLREREKKEIEELSRIAEAVSGVGGPPYVVQKLEEMAARKRASIGETAPQSNTLKHEKTEDPLFIQPL